MTVATLPQVFTIADILKDSSYKLGQFKDEDIKDLETRITFRDTKKEVTKTSH